MLWVLGVMLIIFWLLGFESGYMGDDFGHIPLFLAIFVLLVQVEKECGETCFVTARQRRRQVRREAVVRAGRVLPRLVMPSVEKVD